ncbi:hypothetical protein [Paraburkholderia sediminicola]|uniref:hypothetical protein n=1 Tax=Paraburkholderia sediminicola TaxID=458836 RepID=UPI0038B8DFDC
MATIDNPFAPDASNATAPSLPPPDDFESFLQDQKQQPSTPSVDLTSAKPDDFESFLQDQKTATATQQAQATVVANSQSSTATALQAASVARQTGLPQAAIETDLPRYQAQATAQQNADAVSNSPKLAQWVADNPASARAAQDDLPAMAKIENLLGPYVSAFGKEAAGSINSLSLALNRGIGAVASGIDTAAGTNLSGFVQQNLIAPSLENRAALATPENVPFGVKAAGAAGNLLGMIGTIAATGGLGTAAEGAEGVASVGDAVTQAVTHGARAMAAPALSSAVNTGTDVYNQTGDLGQAVRAAQGSYLTTTLGGIVPLGVPGGLLSRLATGAVSGVATGEVSRQAMNAVLPESMRTGFDPQQTILSALVGAGLGGAIGPRALSEGVQQAHADALSAETAQRGGEAVEQIGQLSAGNKLRASDPEAFRQFVAAASEDSPLSSVYVDGKTFADALHQSEVDPANIPGLQDRINEATATGGDVEIPIADYAAHIAGTDLDKSILPELKTEEGGMTYAEGQRFYQNAADEMQGRAQDIVAQQGEQDATNADVKAIGDTLFSQMQATGRFPADVSRASVVPATEFYRTMAERTGMTAAELFEAHPLRIAGEPIEGALEQPARGAFDPDSNTIALLKGADLTTALHESAHFFLSTMGDLAARPDAPQQIRDDMQTAITWMGGKDLADWQERTLEQQREMHEKFAQGFEQYLMDGRAPTTELQGLFSRFRSWLVNVYRSVTGLGAELTPEVRGVFDRMLATDEAIRQTEAARGYMPLDLSATDATDKQKADYAAAGEQATQDAIADMQARSIRDMQWASNAKSKAIKDLQREANLQRELIREEVTRELDDSPVEKARQFIAAHDLSTKDAASMDLVAEQFKLGTGAELVDALAVDPKAQIDALTDQRMLERHGELTDPAAIDAAANEAVHNEARARFMATGLKLLTKSPIPVRDMAKAATDAANRAIAAKRVGDVNPRQYEVAETKANREAIAQAPKDPAKAAEAQRQALLSNRLAKAARDAVADIKKIVASQARYDKDSIRSKMDPDILDQIDALRERFDFRQKPTQGPTKEQVSLQTWVDSQKAMGYVPVEHPGMMDPTVRMHYKDMTVEQLRGFNDTIRSMEQIARERKSITIEGRKVDLDDAVGELVDKMKERGEKFTLEDLVQPPRAGTDSLWSVGLDKMSAFLRASVAEFKPQQFKANQFDLHEVGGPFTKAIFERVFNANYAKVDMLRSLSNDFRDAAAKLGADWQKGLTDLVPNRTLLDADLTQETGKTVYRKLTRGDMLGIARHVGNESNFDKLTNGMGWEPRDVWAFLNSNMTAKDWEATQRTWDAFEKHWPAMVEMNRRLGNMSPDHIEPRPFRTPDGTEMRGGYAPIDYDANPNRSRRAGRNASAEAINPAEGLFGREYFRADTTTNGSLNARTGYYDRLDLDFHSVERRLHDTVHDLAYREALLDVHKVLTDKEFRRQFQLTYGPEQYKSLNKWIGDLANGQNRDSANSALLKVADMTRHGLMRVGIAFRLSTVLKHGGSALAKSGSYFSGGGEKYFAARAAKVATDHAGQVAGAVEKFSEIRARALQQDRDYRELTASMFEPESLQSRMDRAGHSFVAFADLMSAVPTAWAAYDRAITDGIPENRGGTGKPMSEADAIAYANQLVREAHGSNIESARSMVLQEHNELVKSVTMLYGFMNNSLGQALDMADKARMTGFSKPELFARVLGSIIVPALVSGALASHKKEEGWAEWAAKAITGEVAGMVPLVRDAWSYAEGHQTAGINPFMQGVTNVGKAVKDVAQIAQGKQPKAPIRDIGNAIGLAIPGMGQAGTTAQYLADVASGKQQPKNPLDVARGVALGQGNK